MILIDNYSQVAAQIETERGISRDLLASAIEQALVSACKRNYSEETELVARIDPVTGEARIWIQRTVVKKVEDENLEVTLTDAKVESPGIELGEVLETEITPDNFGRIAAQTAKQVIVQRIREAEKDSIFAEFEEKAGTLITGVVQRIEGRNYLINLGRIEAILNPREQIQDERFQVKEKIRLYVVGVERGMRGPVVRISRSHPGLLRCLFELEVPEIADGVIEIVNISRDAGKRAKVAVKTNNPAVSAIGTCVGHMGGRIQAITKEIGNEKIDILEWNENIKTFIASSLKPATITDVIITDEENRNAIVVVPNDQLSLAIGKMGINVRLAVKLTNWKLDIISEQEYQNRAEEIQTAQPSTLEQMFEGGASDTAEESASEDSSDAAADEGEKVKVSALAKELGIKTAELMEQAAEKGVEIKSNRVQLSPADADNLRQLLS